MSSDNTGLSVSRPSFLANVNPNEAKGLAAVREYSRPPRLKIIQAQSGELFKPRFNDGDIIVNPYFAKVGDTKSPFTFTPVHYFMAFVCINPHDLKDKLQMIRGYTLDPKDLIAVKAKKYINEDCPEDAKYEIKYRMVHNYMIVIESEDPAVKDTPIAVTFMQGEFKTGSMLNDMLLARKVDIFANRFCAISGRHKGPKGTWYGLDFLDLPNPWVTEEQYQRYSQYWDMYDELVKNKQIEIDMGDTDMQEEGGTTNSQF